MGLAISSTKWFFKVSGAFGGALLGPLAVLVIFVSPVGRGGRKRKCPQPSQAPADEPPPR